jgi:hypothetical protein
MSHPPHPPRFNHPNNIRWRIQSVKFIIVQFSPRPIFSLLGPNILLNTLSSETVSLCSSLKVRDQVSHPYSTTGKITILYTLIFRFFIWDGKTKDFGLNNSKHSQNLICSWCHHECYWIQSSETLFGNRAWLNLWWLHEICIVDGPNPYLMVGRGRRCQQIQESL